MNGTEQDLNERLAGFVHDVVFHLPQEIKDDCKNRYIAIPYVFQRAIVKTMQKTLDFHNQVARGLVGNVLARFMDFEVVPGYEIAVVVFHRDTIFNPNEIYRVNLPSDFV